MNATRRIGVVLRAPAAGSLAHRSWWALDLAERSRSCARQQPAAGARVQARVLTPTRRFGLERGSSPQRSERFQTGGGTRQCGPRSWRRQRERGRAIAKASPYIDRRLQQGNPPAVSAQRTDVKPRAPNVASHRSRGRGKVASEARHAAPFETLHRAMTGVRRLQRLVGQAPDRARRVGSPSRTRRAATLATLDASAGSGIRMRGRADPSKPAAAAVGNAERERGLPGDVPARSGAIIPARAATLVAGSCRVPPRRERRAVDTR